MIVVPSMATAPRGLSGRAVVLLAIAIPGFRSFAEGELHFTLGCAPTALQANNSSCYAAFTRFTGHDARRADARQVRRAGRQ
jgi:hypothetical protein